MSDCQTLPQVPRQAVLAGAMALLLSLSFVLGGCRDEKASLEKTYVAAPSGAPGAAAASLRTAFFAEEITANGAINLAHERLEKAGDAPSVVFAAAVLDFLAQVEPDINKKVINDFFWMRVGTLAANAAAAARKADDREAAYAVVLAGPKGWKTENYWLQHPAHDALASVILFEANEGDAALARLRDRANLDDQVVQAKEFIESEMRKGRGKKK